MSEHSLESSKGSHSMDAGGGQVSEAGHVELRESEPRLSDVLTNYVNWHARLKAIFLEHDESKKEYLVTIQKLEEKINKRIKKKEEVENKLEKLEKEYRLLFDEVKNQILFGEVNKVIHLFAEHKSHGFNALENDLDSHNIISETGTSLDSTKAKRKRSEKSSEE